MLSHWEYPVPYWTIFINTHIVITKALVVTGTVLLQSWTLLAGRRERRVCGMHTYSPDLYFKEEYEYFPIQVLWQTNRHCDRQAVGRQADGRTDRMTGGQAGGRLGRQADRQTGRQQADRHKDSETKARTNKQTNKQTSRPHLPYYLVKLGKNPVTNNYSPVIHFFFVSS